MISELFGIGSKIIDTVSDYFPSEKAKNEAKLKLMQMEEAGELNELKTRLDVIKTEAKSKDPWTSRARPSFMYVFYLIILLAVPVAILGIFNPIASESFTNGLTGFWSAIPSDLYWLFGAGYLGYSGFRTIDKRTLKR
jgi:hypothetical protein